MWSLKSLASAVVLFASCDYQPQSTQKQAKHKQHSVKQFEDLSQEEPNITVLYPNGGETIDRSTEFTIRWESHEVGERVKIQIHGGPDHNRGGWYLVAKDTENDGAYPFALPQDWGWNEFKVCISALNDPASDQSDRHFESRYGMNLAATPPGNDTNSTTRSVPSVLKIRARPATEALEVVSRTAAIGRIRELGGTYLSNGVSFRGDAITDTAMEYVGVLTDLTHLALIDTQVTDEGMRHVSDLTKLEYLAFGGTHEITYAGIARLKGLTNLKQLDLRGTTLTEDEELAIQAAMPNCQIIGNTVVDPFRRTR